MEFDALVLARLQFAFTIAFHILFPALTIGLASFLFFLEACWLRTGDPLYHHMYRFWVRIFALAFGLGVVTGVVLSYQFGTNWSRFSTITGNVLGPLMAYEVLTAFFLEAGFLGIMLFGWNRVGPVLHIVSTGLVAVGTVVSAFWILSANSWMQTPAGHVMENGVFAVADWWTVVFNPSFPYRLAHMLIAAYLTTGFVIAGVSAWYLLRREHDAFARRGLSLAMWAVLVLAPLQIYVGDRHGLQVLRDQPVKLAAIEANWERGPHRPLLLFAWPDAAAEENRFEIGIPDGASLLLGHARDAVVPGLTEVPPGDRPNVPLVFFAFRLMVGIGLLMLLTALAGLWLRWRGGLYERRWFLVLAAAMTPSGFVAVLAGWVTAEAGRQPWTVQGLLRTADSVSPVAAEAVAASLLLFFVVYNLLLAAFLWFGWRMVHHGPAPAEMPAPAIGSHRPLSVPGE